MKQLKIQNAEGKTISRKIEEIKKLKAEIKDKDAKIQELSNKNIKNDQRVDVEQCQDFNKLVKQKMINLKKFNV